jgi:hypothetical protein
MATDGFGSARAFRSLEFHVHGSRAEHSRTRASSQVRKIQSIPSVQTLDPDDALAPGVVDSSVLTIVVMIGVISIAAMVVPVVGHRVSDCRATDAAHDRADRPADNGPGDGATDCSSNRAAFVSKGNLR